MTATSPVLKQIAGLPKLSQDELQALWREYFGVSPRPDRGHGEADRRRSARRLSDASRPGEGSPPPCA